MDAALHAPSSFAPAFVQGALTMAGLIVAIGAQNALVLRQGLARAHVVPVVLVCTVSDWLLTALGVFGLGALLALHPAWMDALRYGGAAFLLAYAARAAHAAWRGHERGLQAAGPHSGLGRALGTTLALTYLNPHVYLDTVVLMGSLGAQHPPAGRIAFVAGAGLASSLWFATLGAGAVALSGVLRRPQVWRAIDATVAIVMTAVALQLLFGA